ncbi:MAG: RNA-directed DNA polymerase [Deltaproteobacteria bacterium]
MVQRCRATLDDVANLGALASAFHRAARGKTGREDVERFRGRPYDNLAALGDGLRQGTAPSHVYRRFSIRDPKPRVIHAPVFEDRGVHHAVMAAIGPTLDRALVDDTFACRVGKGSLAAVQRAQVHTRRWPWYVKLDVAKYFASIPHDRLCTALDRKLKDREVRALVRRIVRGFGAGRGLPIGSLTSQSFANFYLAPLDRCLAEDGRVRGYVRYMDDVVAWTQTRAEAERVRTMAAMLLQEVLDLRPKGPGFVQRSHAGLSFLGFRIYPGVLKLSRRRMRRYARSRRAWEALYREGVLDALALQRAYDAAFAITAHAEASGFRRADLERAPTAEA